MSKLTDKQTLFVEHYLQCWNSAEAARRAGYSERSVYDIGYENLRKPDIQEQIQRRIAAVAMSADEVLLRLAEHARGSLRPFLTEGDDGNLYHDFNSDEAQKKFHLLKKLKTKKREGGAGEERWTETEVEIEIHDPQAALVHLGRHHKLFTDSLEHSGPDRNPIPVLLNSTINRAYSDDNDNSEGKPDAGEPGSD